MKTQLLILLCLSTFSCTLFAQNQQPVIIVSTNVNVMDAKDKKKPKKNYAAGAVLKNTQQIEIGKDTKTLLYCNGEFKEINKKGNYDLQSAFKKETRIATLNFDPFFGEYLYASVALVDELNEKGEFSKSKVLRGNGWGITNKGTTGGGWGITNKGTTGGGWGITNKGTTGGGWGITDKSTTGGGWGITDKSTTGGGWGITNKGTTGGGWSKSDEKIAVATPGGLYTNAKMSFKWISNKTGTSYNFRILTNDGEVKQAMPANTDTTLLIDLQSLNLSVDETYYWQITTNSEPMEVSRPMVFKIISNEDYLEIKNSAQNSNIYENAQPEIKQLMEAAALEKGKLFYEAELIFQSLLKNYPSNNLIKISYSTFCSRLGQTNKARSLLK